MIFFITYKGIKLPLDSIFLDIRITNSYFQEIVPIYFCIYMKRFGNPWIAYYASSSNFGELVTLFHQLSPQKPSLRETRGFRTRSIPSLSNRIKMKQAFSPTLLSLRPSETRSQSPSSPRLITFSCLRPASTDTFDSQPQPIKSPLLLLFTIEGPTQTFRRFAFLV